MAAPTPPYSVSGQVALFLLNLLRGGTDFSASTAPTKTHVESIITLVGSQVDMQFGSVGYKIPFVVMTGETWPTSQTNYLTLLTCLGTAAYVGGHNLKPAPAVAPGKEGAAGNVFQDAFNREMRKIWDGHNTTSLKWRADYYIGTKAEYTVSLPSGPVTDFMEQYFDAGRYLSLFDVTEQLRAVQEEIKDLDIDWDYMYSYKSYNAGLGSVQWPQRS